MVDQMVQQSQQWLNATYRDVAGYRPVEENGRTGWSTMYAITRALQHELGITALSNNFGAGTLSRLTAQHPRIDAATSDENVVRLVQAGLWCKGYFGSAGPTATTGTYDGTTSTSVSRLKDDMGVAGVYPGDAVTPKVCKALLTMDPYVLVGDGTSAVRTVQRWLNATYVDRRDFFIVPCEGSFSRTTQKALMLAIQFEIGMSDNVANGVFGPGTRAGLRDQADIGLGDSDRATQFVRLFQGAMTFNRYPVPFDGSFGSATAATVAEFQRFAALSPVNGRADFQTWASLLVSTGDPTRPGTACDCVDMVTPDRAATLYAAGYRVVGRYLTNTVGGTLDKRIQDGELRAIVDGGLRVFPIYQAIGRSTDHFGPEQGRSDARAAIAAARWHGFRPGTGVVIYFAVDFDALDHEVTSHVIPHFEAIDAEFARFGREYDVGIYGPRNVCSRVAAAGLSTSSFVSGMSTGYSGNLGFPLPRDWAYDQIATLSLGSGAGAIEIDKNIASGRDLGTNDLLLGRNDPVPDVRLPASQEAALRADLTDYFTLIGQPTAVSGFIRSISESIDIVLSFDEWITRLSSAYGIRKSLIQAPLLWETRGRQADDVGLDSALEEYYRQRQEYEEGIVPVPPVTIRDDSSTGLGAVFGRTAIRAHNLSLALELPALAVDAYNTDEPTPRLRRSDVYDSDDWHDVRDMWRAIRYSNTFCVGMIPLVLIDNAFRSGLGIDSLQQLNYAPTELTDIIKLYNGSGEAAEQFAHWVSGIYHTFEKHNTPAREL